VDVLRRQGLRERIRKLEDAPGASFAIGRFEVVLEELPEDGSDAPGRFVRGTDPVLVPLLAKPIAGMDRGAPPDVGRLPPRLALCYDCKRHIYAHETTCPHCGGDVAAGHARQREDHERAEALIARLSGLMARLGAPPAPAEAAAAD
jgi:hypothetical protein